MIQQIRGASEAHRTAFRGPVIRVLAPVGLPQPGEDGKEFAVGDRLPQHGDVVVGAGEIGALVAVRKMNGIARSRSSSATGYEVQVPRLTSSTAASIASRRASRIATAMLPVRPTTR